MKTRHLAGMFMMYCAYSSSAVAEELSLKCEGEGTYSVVETSFTNNNKKKDSGTDTTSVTKQQTTRGPIRFVLGDYNAKVKIPPAMLPLMSNEDKDGWLKVQNLKVNDAEIRGEVDIGTFASADLVIDRRSGEISIDGGSRKYNGTCAKDTSPEKGNKF